MIRRVLGATAPGAILATLGLAAALAFHPVSTATAVDGYILVIGGVALVGLVGAATKAEPDSRRSIYDQAIEPRAPDAERPQELTRIEREVALGIDSAFYAHFRLRPLLREIADQRLETRFGTTVLAARGEARASLPDDAWELFEPDRPAPRNPHARGLARERLRGIVDALEDMERV